MSWSAIASLGQMNAYIHEGQGAGELGLINTAETQFAVGDLDGLGRLERDTDEMLVDETLSESIVRDSRDTEGVVREQGTCVKFDSMRYD